MPVMKQGTPVKWTAPVCAGTVERARISEDEVAYLVNFTDGDGLAHQRWFRESELTVTGEAPAEASENSQ